MTHDDISDAEIEAVYEALTSHSGDWDKNPSIVVRAAIRASRAALLAEGRKVTAREPSKVMGEAAGIYLGDYKSTWRAMWDKAP